MLYSALRKLPGVLSYALAPKYFITSIEEDNPDIRSVAFAVEHNRTFGPLIFNPLKSTFYYSYS